MVMLLISKVVIVLTYPQFSDGHVADSKGEYCKGCPVKSPVDIDALPAGKYRLV
jgi:hypothetical protein